MPAQRLPAERARARRAESSRCRRSSRRCSPRSATRRSTSADWMWEPKLDGYRVLAFIDGEGVKLRSRRGLDLARRFPEARGGARASRRSSGMILDGEIVAFDADGKPSFNALQNRAQRRADARVVFFCFDLLHFAGIDLRKAPYRDRRRYLAQCLLPSPLVQLVHACRGRRRAARGGARERLRGRDRQAQGQPLRGRQALGVVAQGQGDATAAISWSAATRRARARARRSARCSSATGKAASCATPRTSARASTTRRSAQAKKRLEPLRAQDACPFAEKPRAATRRRPGSSRSSSPR